MKRPSEAPAGAARFEAMLRQVLTTEAEARNHRSAKDLRTVARQMAAGAKARFERGRERVLKSRERQPEKSR